jgi:hypothetical protein
MINEMAWHGTYEIFVNGKLEKTIKNRILDAALDQFIKILQGTAPNMQIKYLAVGTGGNAISGSDTQLQTEIFRTPVTSQTKTATGEVKTEFVIFNDEAIGAIKEIGIFGGSSATGTANTGVLISRILWNFNKTADKEINIRRTDKVVSS